MKTRSTDRTAQSGIMLLEALIAILIFSLGILALVALQATSIKLTGDAKYRTDATLLANRLIGQMWVRGGDLATLKADFESPAGTAYSAWLVDPDPKKKTGVRDTLPGVSGGAASTLPLVDIQLTASSALVTITLFWRTPEMSTREPGHRHIVTTQIAKNL